MNPVCFYCGALGRHDLCTGMVRPISLPAEPCTCDYALHPSDGRRRWTLPPVGSARTAAAVYNPGGKR